MTDRCAFRSSFLPIRKETGSQAAAPAAVPEVTSLAAGPACFGLPGAPRGLERALRRAGAGAFAEGAERRTRHALVSAATPLPHRPAVRGGSVLLTPPAPVCQSQSPNPQRPSALATQQSPLGGAEVRYPGLRFGALRLGALPCSVALRNGPLVGPLPALDRGSGNAVSFWKTPSAASAPGRLCGRLLSQVEQVTAERRTPGARRQTRPARLAPPTAPGIKY